MKASKTVILGDPHIGRSISIGRPGIGSTLNSRILDQFELLEWVLDQTIDYEADRIVITGDIFEAQNPHPTLVSLFIQWLQKCSDHNIEVHLIVGNHDLIRSGSFKSSALDIISTANLDRVFVYHEINTIYSSGASFTLMPFRDRRSFSINSNAEAVKLLGDKIPYELGEIDSNQLKVVIGHFALEGSIPIGDEIDDMANEIFCPLDMFSGYDFTVMGHVHKPQILKTDTNHCMHIGSMDLSNFGETDHTKIIVLLDPDKELPFEYLELPTRPLRQISVSVPADIIHTTDYVSNQLKTEQNLNRSIVKLDISLNSSSAPPVDRKVIERQLLNMGAFHIAKINEEKKVSLVKKKDGDNIDGTMNELMAVKMYADANVEKNKQPDFVALASSIVKEYQADAK